MLIKVLVIGIFGIIAVMVISAAIHLVAVYVAFILVLSFICWIVTKLRITVKQDQQK